MALRVWSYVDRLVADHAVVPYSMLLLTLLVAPLYALLKTFVVAIFESFYEVGLSDRSFLMALP